MRPYTQIHNCVSHATTHTFPRTLTLSWAKSQSANMTAVLSHVCSGGRAWGRAPTRYRPSKRSLLTCSRSIFSLILSQLGGRKSITIPSRSSQASMCASQYFIFNCARVHKQTRQRGERVCSLRPSTSGLRSPTGNPGGLSFREPPF